PASVRFARERRVDDEQDDPRSRPYPNRARKEAAGDRSTCDSASSPSRLKRHAIALSRELRPRRAQLTAPRGCVILAYHTLENPEVENARHVDSRRLSVLLDSRNEGRRSGYLRRSKRNRTQ